MNPSDILSAIQCCWCELLESSLGGAPAACCITAGAPSIPECCGGYAWVRFTGAYPSITFPSHASQPNRACVEQWALQVEVGITRCAPTPCDVLGNSCCDAEANASAIMLDDLQQIRKLFTCGCLGIPVDSIIIGNVTVYGPEGGCLGITATATIRSD